MSDEPEALRLADRCESLSQIADAYSAEAYEQAAAELRRQRAEIEALKAERDALRAELVERNAARNAYASEFPPDHDGKHNVGIILLNIRNLKFERDALLKALVDLMPLAEFGAAEQSPPYADEHLLNAAQAAIDAAREEMK